MLTTTQTRTAQAIINIFETGEVLGKYSQVTLITDDTGHLTFGRSQTTLASGNLHALLRRYCEQEDARFAARIEPYLPQLQNRDLSLDNDLKLKNVLRASADDPTMREAQDAFFDEFYWEPAKRAAMEKGIRTPLGVTVLYDSHVHGSWGRMCDRTVATVGSVATVGEETWISSYLTVRRDWLASASSSLRTTVYRMDAFRLLIDQGKWNLELPLVVRDKEISIATLSAIPSDCYDGPQPGSRVLSVQKPRQRGLDVRLVQLGLSDRGADIVTDGIFGPTSSQRLREFQAANGLSTTGVADPALIARLVA